MEMTPRGTERRLRAYLEEKAERYDYVLIDCPPTISIFTQAAILASSKYLVPIKPDPLSVVGLPLLERWLEDFTQDAGITLMSVGLVFTMVRGPVPQRMSDIMDDLRDSRGTEVFDEQLSVSTYVATSVEHHQPIFRYKKYSKPSKEMRGVIWSFTREPAELFDGGRSRASSAPEVHPKSCRCPGRAHKR
jgi:chromosome partitioning protein